MKTVIAYLLLTAVAWATCTNAQTPAVTQVCTTGSTTCVVTVTAIPSGHVVVVWSSSVAASITITGVADSGNTYSHCLGGSSCAGSDATGGASSDIYGTLSTTTSSGTSITVTRSASGTAWSSGVYDFTCTGTPVLDANNAADDSTASTSLAGANLTGATGTNDVFIQVASLTTSQINSIDQGYTIDVGGNTRKAASLFNSTNKTTPTWTILANARAAVSGVAIRDNQPLANKSPRLLLMGVGN